MIGNEQFLNRIFVNSPLIVSFLLTNAGWSRTLFSIVSTLFSTSSTTHWPLYSRLPASSPSASKLLSLSSSVSTKNVFGWTSRKITQNFMFFSMNTKRKFQRILFLLIQSSVLFQDSDVIHSAVYISLMDTEWRRQKRFRGSSSWHEDFLLFLLRLKVWTALLLLSINC